MGIFWLELYKTIVIFEVKTIVILKFCEVTKMSKFGIKNALFCYFWAKILNKLYSYLKSATLKVVEKQKCLNLCPEMPYLGIFRLEFENNIVIFEISTNCSNWKISRKNKNPKFGNKNDLFG